MPLRDWDITLFTTTFEGEVLSVEPLLFPEINCCDIKYIPLRDTVIELVRTALDRTAAFQLQQRILPQTARLSKVEVKLDPPRPKLDWAAPVVLRFDVARWSHGSDGLLALVPALGIEVIARRETEMPKLLAEQILTALRRSKAAESLFELTLTQRATKAELMSFPIGVILKTAKQRGVESESDDKPRGRPAIDQVGQVLGLKPLPPAYQVDDVVAQMAEALTSRSPRSLLLVGPSGCGKTSAMHELVTRRKSHNLANTPFWSTSGARLIAGMSGYGMWQQRCQQLCKEAAREGAILHLGNLIELMQVGRIGSGTGIAGFLRPYIARGDLLVIAECTPEQLPVIERLDPHLLELFHQMRFEEPNEKIGRLILQSVALGKEIGSDEKQSSPWLAPLDRLHRRYATYSAYPGRPVRFLQNLLKDVGDTARTESDVITAFSRETGLPRFMLDPDVMLDLAQARSWFAGRLIGQARGIDLVVDLLATVKASLNRPRRPIASLLFVGPTGVGKTEMAKAIAEYFFGDRARLTRFDMSEFVSPAAVERLIGNNTGTEGLLTAKVREQPFSVILFDEFEKAHSAFFDLLLQVLGEGRLTDAAGRLGDFSNTIIVMTSNLGAQTFGRGSFGLNKGGGYPDAELYFTDEVRSFMRPELFNRIDRIVPFSPLDQDSIGKIAQRELDLVEQRDGIKQRGLTLTVSPEAVAHLVAKGYDIRYGARPLKRAIERELLAPLADAVNGYAQDAKLEAMAKMNGTSMVVEVRARGQATAETSAAIALNDLAQDCARFRRDVQRCQQCSPMQTLSNQLFMLERDQARQEARRKPKERPVYVASQVQRIKELHKSVDELEGISQAINQMEAAALAAFYSHDTVAPTIEPAELSALRQRLDALLLALLAMQSTHPHGLVLGVLGHRQPVQDMARVYYEMSRQLGYHIEAYWYVPHGKQQFNRTWIKDIAKWLAAPSPTAIGIGLGITGSYAGLRFASEKGVHAFKNGSKTTCAIVEVSDSLLRKYTPSGGRELSLDVKPSQTRRLYSPEEGLVKDAVLNSDLRWNGRDLRAVVESAIQQQMQNAARTVLYS